MISRIMSVIGTFTAALIVVMGGAIVSSAGTEPVQSLNDRLFAACEHGDLEALRRLLAQGADVNAKGLFSSTPLMRAASTGHEEVVEELISRGADVNMKSWRGLTALMNAALWSDDARVVEKLLEHKAEVNAADDDGLTALMRAARRGKLDMVRSLVAHGARIDAASVQGATALDMAAEENRCQIVAFLREHGARYDICAAAAVGDVNELQRYASAGGDLSAREKVYGRSLLWFAAHNGHVEAVTWLLDRKADVEAEGPNGETPLHAAAESGHQDVVALLIDRGAKIEARDEARAMMALHKACLFDRPETVRLLLDRGCDIEDRDKGWGQTPLIVAAGSGSLAVVQILLQRGAKINAVDAKGRTALMSAAQFQKTDTVRALLAAGADVRQKDAEDHYTALHYACCTEECSEEGVRIAEVLMRNGAKVTQPNRDGFSALDCAASHGCEALTDLLVNRAELRWPRARLEKALLLSASDGHFSEKVASLLIQAGASVNCKDATGYTPLMHADELGDARAVGFLIKNGAHRTGTLRTPDEPPLR